MKNKTSSSSFVSCLLNSSFLIAVFSLAVSPAAAQPDKVIRIQLGGEPSTLDPARVIDQYGFGILRNVVEGLYRIDPAGELIPGLAEKHELSKNGLTYKFKLRSDAKWSDGKPVVAEDFVVALRHALDPKTASVNADYFFAIKNARDIFSGKLPVEKLGVSGQGLDLSIELERKDPNLLLALTLPPAAPLRKDILVANGGKWSHLHPVTGDYVISAYRPADQIELKPNPNGRNPNSHSILYRILPEEITAMNLFEAGSLEVITTITSTEIPRYRAQNFIKTVPSTTVFSFSFNVSKPPFNDPDWRKAVASSFDREGLAKALNGVFEPITSYLPKTIDGSLPYKPANFKASVEKIRALKNKPSIRLAYGASAFTKTVAEKVQYDLEQKLGVKLILQPMELKTLLGLLQTDPPEMYFLGKSAVYNDPINQLNSFGTATGDNFSRYKSAEYDRLLEQIKMTAPGAKKSELAQRANEILIEKDVAVVPLLLRLQVFGVSKSLKGFQVSPYQVIHLKGLTR